ncbi:hypothetical protein PMIN02_006085 [Paraphaeosphaeria minitans]
MIALSVVGAGVWARFIIQDIQNHGFIILDVANLESQNEDAAWRAFILTAIETHLRIWVAIAAGAFSTLATLLVTLSTTLPRLRLPTPFLLPLELLSSLSLATAFAATLSLALKFPVILSNSPSSSDLAAFAMLLPLTRGYAIGAGGGMVFSLTTTTSFLVQTIHRIRDSKACSFEPTASGLGMGHEYQVPAMEGGGAQSKDEEKGLAGAGAEMGGRESVQSGSGTGMGMGKRKGEKVSWPLAVAKKLDNANIRPHRPWSEMPRK